MSDMNEDNKPLDAPAGAASGAGALRNSLVSRRRFAKAGAASSVVLGSLVAKPVLAYTDKQIYHCTVSGQLSGNFSSHPDVVPCTTLGKSPGYWKNHPSAWPTGTVAGTLPSKMCSFASPKVRGTAFGGTSGLPDAFKSKAVANTTSSGTTYSCLTYDVLDAGNFPANATSATMLEVLSCGGGLNETSLKALGRATVASLLNAMKATPDAPYALTPKQVVDMFTAVYKGGTYKLNNTKSWTATQVLTYFETLYDKSAV